MLSFPANLLRPCKAVCLQYRSIRVPTGSHALYTRSYCGDELSAHHWGIVGVGVHTIRRTLSVIYGIMPIGCCDSRSAQRPAEVS